MTAHSQLYSKPRPHCADMTGNATNLYKMTIYMLFLINVIKIGKILSVLAVDTNCQWTHVVAPHLAVEVQGNQIDAVGNQSKVQGKFRLVCICSASSCGFQL